MRHSASIWILAMLLIGSGAAAAEVPAFSLDDFEDRWIRHDGSEVTLSDWKGRTLFLAPFYTSCERVCPRTVQTLKKIQSTLDERSREADILLVTLDPVVDTARTLDRYRTNKKLRDNWHLIRADRDQTSRLMEALEFKNWRADADQHVIHDFRIYEFDHDGHLVRMMDWNDKVSDLLD